MTQEHGPNRTPYDRAAEAIFLIRPRAYASKVPGCVYG